MNVGDFVTKVKGRHTGKSGMILEISNQGKPRFEILSVLVEGEIEKWPLHLTEVNHEDGDCNCGRH